MANVREQKDRSGPRSKIAIGVVVALVVAGLGVAAVLWSQQGEPEPQPQSSGSPSSETPAGDASVCGLTDFEDESSLIAPPANEWELVGTVAAPIDSDGAGPGVIASDGFRSCYSRTAQGALFAAVTQVALSTDRRFSDQMHTLFEKGPGLDAAQAAAEEMGSDTVATRAQVAGFKVNAYTADEAIIDVVWSVTSSGGALVSFPVVLHWSEGDWKIVLDDDGQAPLGVSGLDSLGGYIPWAGA